MRNNYYRSFGGFGNGWGNNNCGCNNNYNCNDGCQGCSNDNNCYQECCCCPIQPCSCIMGPTGPAGPIGPTGPTGPVGPAGVTATNQFLQVASVPLQAVTAGATVNLGGVVSQNGTSAQFVTPDTITLAGGSYLVTFNAVATSTTAGNVGVSMVVNGATISTSAPAVAISAGAETIITAQAIVTPVSLSTMTFENETALSVSYRDVTVTVTRLM